MKPRQALRIFVVILSIWAIWKVMVWILSSWAEFQQRQALKERYLTEAREIVTSTLPPHYLQQLKELTPYGYNLAVAVVAANLAYPAGACLAGEVRRDGTFNLYSQHYPPVARELVQYVEWLATGIDNPALALFVYCTAISVVFKMREKELAQAA